MRQELVAKFSEEPHVWHQVTSSLRLRHGDFINSIAEWINRVDVADPWKSNEERVQTEPSKGSPTLGDKQPARKRMPAIVAIVVLVGWVAVIQTGSLERRRDDEFVSPQGMNPISTKTAEESEEVMRGFNELVSEQLKNKRRQTVKDKWNTLDERLWKRAESTSPADKSSSTNPLLLLPKVEKHQSLQ